MTRSFWWLLLGGLAACDCSPHVVAVNPRIVVTPTKLDFGTVAVDTMVDAPIEITNQGRAPLTVSSLKAQDTNDISVASGLATGCDLQPRHVDNPSVLAPDECARVTIRFKATTTESIKNSIVIASNDPVNPTVTVPVVAAAKVIPLPQIQVCVLDTSGNVDSSQCSDLAANPPIVPTLDFGRVSGGQTAVRKLRITDVGSVALSVSSLQARANPADLTIMDPPALPASIASMMHADVQVALSPTGNGMLTGKVIIQSNAAGESEVDVPVTAQEMSTGPTIQFTAPMLTQSSPPLAAVMGTSPVAVTVSSAAPVQSVSITFDSNQLLAGWTSPSASTTTFQQSVDWMNKLGAGMHTLTAKVTDVNGHSGTATRQVQVPAPACTAPTAHIQAMVGQTAVSSTGVLQMTNVTLRGSGTGGSSAAASYAWTLVSAPSGNMSQLMPNGATASLYCTEVGTYTVGLVVTDKDGCVSQQATLSIRVNAPPPACGPSTQFIYTVDESGVLYQFTPGTASFKSLGSINCGALATVNTMAVDRLGIAWVEYEDGSLYRVDTSNLNCYPTSFNSSQTSSTAWGSCFAVDSAGSTNETYFIADGGELQTLNPMTLTVSTVGPFTGFSGTMSNEPELTATPSGDLYGFFPGSPWQLGHINRTNGAILSQTPLSVISNSISSPSSWAFASWGNDFWFFVGSGFSTKVFHYDATTGNTSQVTSTGSNIVGAGVSPCVLAH